MNPEPPKHKTAKLPIQW